MSVKQKQCIVTKRPHEGSRAFLLTCLLPSRIDPLRFQAKSRGRRPNLIYNFIWFVFILFSCFCMLAWFVCVSYPFSWFSFCFLSISQEIGQEERLQNGLFYVEWDVKPQLNNNNIAKV